MRLEITVVITFGLNLVDTYKEYPLLIFQFQSQFQFLNQHFKMRLVKYLM